MLGDEAEVEQRVSIRALAWRATRGGGMGQDAPMFRSALSRGERPARKLTPTHAKLVSIRALAWRATGQTTPNVTPSSLFRSALSRGERHACTRRGIAVKDVSIRALAWRATRLQLSPPVPGRVSIRALAWRATPVVQGSASASWCFDPRSRVESDVEAMMDASQESFDPRSRVESDACCSGVSVCVVVFRSALSRGERQAYSSTVSPR